MNQTEPYVIREISDRTFDPNASAVSTENYRIRKASRGILLKEGKIALLHVYKRGYYKFPGGGIEENETKENAFKREVREETGCDCKTIDYAGITREYRGQSNLLQISHIFMAKVIGEPGKQMLEQGEIDDGHDLVWLTVKEAEKVMSEGKPDELEHKFIHLRDWKILQYYKEKILKEILK